MPLFQTMLSIHTALGREGWARLAGSKQKKGGLSVRTDLSFPPYKAKLCFHPTQPPAFFVTVGLALKHSGNMIQQGTGQGTASIQALSESCQHFPNTFSCLPQECLISTSSRHLTQNTNIFLLGGDFQKHCRLLQRKTGPPHPSEDSLKTGHGKWTFQMNDL